MKDRTIQRVNWFHFQQKQKHSSAQTSSVSHGCACGVLSVLEPEESTMWLMVFHLIGNGTSNDLSFTIKYSSFICSRSCDAALAVCSMHQFIVYPKTNGAVFKRQGGALFLCPTSRGLHYWSYVVVWGKNILNWYLDLDYNQLPPHLPRGAE